MMKALNNGMKIVLASKSPRRRELLGLITEDFEVLTADTDERCDIPEPDELCEELAFRKACDVYSILRRGNRNDNAIVIGCDTAVYAGEKFSESRATAGRGADARNAVGRLAHRNKRACPADGQRRFGKARNNSGSV